MSWCIAEIAKHQHGVIAAWQLRALELSASAVCSRLAAGTLHPVHTGVYAVGHPLLSQKGHFMAAVLACGERAVLSHRSAAALWSLRATSRAGVDVISNIRNGRSRPGIDVHRAARLQPQDITEVDGIPCTSVARTLLDLGRVVNERSQSRACEEAEVLRLFDLRAVEELLGRMRGVPGAARLRAAVPSDGVAEAETREELERRFLRLCKNRGLPRPEVNGWLTLEGEALQVDFMWRDLRLAIETDGWETHRTRQAFERDRRRGHLLARAGWDLERFTWRQVTAEPDWTAGTVTQLIARRNSSPFEVL